MNAHDIQACLFPRPRRMTARRGRHDYRNRRRILFKCRMSPGLLQAVASICDVLRPIQPRPAYITHSCSSTGTGILTLD
ncbi:MAG: hypothetical protein WCL44_12995, partial [bacterium]